MVSLFKCTGHIFVFKCSMEMAIALLNHNRIQIRDNINNQNRTMILSYFLLIILTRFFHKSSVDLLAPMHGKTTFKTQSFDRLRIV